MCKNINKTFSNQTGFGKWCLTLLGTMYLRKMSRYLMPHAVSIWENMRSFNPFIVDTFPQKGHLTQ